LYEGGIRVPLIISCPGYIKPGSECDTPTISHDLYPTITEIVSGSSPRACIEGKSLVPLLNGKKKNLARELYWYYPHYSPQAKQPAAAIRSGNYKLIHFYDPERWELYDLSHDLSERNNLTTKMPEKVQQLSKRLETWLKSVNAKMHTLNPKYEKSK